MYSHRAFRTNMVFQVLFYNITSLASTRPTFRTDFLKMIDIRYIHSICTAQSYKTYKSCKHAPINEGEKSLNNIKFTILQAWKICKNMDCLFQKPYKS